MACGGEAWENRDLSVWLSVWLIIVWLVDRAWRWRKAESLRVKRALTMRRCVLMAGRAWMEHTAEYMHGRRHGEESTSQSIQSVQSHPVKSTSQWANPWCWLSVSNPSHSHSHAHDPKHFMEHFMEHFMGMIRIICITF